MLKIKVIKKDGTIQKESSSENRVYLGFWEYLEEGSTIIFEGQKDSYYYIQIDQFQKSLVYLRDGSMKYIIPDNLENYQAFPLYSFKGDSHYFSMEKPSDEDLKLYRNVLLNSYSQKEFNGSFPYAYANVETRNESTFFAANAIDGICVSDNHGRYPYQTWGINRQADAKLTVNIGRDVLVNKIGFILRADFPHDSYWTSITAKLSNGDIYTFKTIKSGNVQYFDIKECMINSIEVYDLIKNEDESPFPALVQLELYGRLK